jgi:sugar lactone lactonase YvrE
MNHRVRRIDAVNGDVSADSNVATIAGNGLPTFTGDRGSAVLAALNTPMGVAVDGAGNVLVADTKNQRVRRVDHTNGVLTTLAGNGRSGFGPDGTGATTAALNHPRSVAVDPSGAIVLTDTGNCLVRRVTDPGTALATIHTVAGRTPTATLPRPCAFGDGRTAIDGTLLNNPSGVAVAADGRIYVADSLNHRIRAITLPA